MEKHFPGFAQGYFQDHSRKIVLGADGVPRTEYVYEGIYYILEGTANDWRRQKLLTLLFVSSAAAMLLWAMLTPAALNRLTDILLLQVLGLFLLLALGFGAFNRLTASSRMTRWEYRMSVLTVKECSLLLALCMGTAALDGLIRLTLSSVVSTPAELAALAKLTGSAAAAWLSWRQICAERYTREQSDDLPSGTDITNDFNPMP